VGAGPARPLYQQRANALGCARGSDCSLDRRVRIHAPILVDSNSGVIAGHGRLLAARKLNLEQVPVIVLDHLTETQKRAYILADNRLAELAGWDEELLRLELEALREVDFNL